MAGAFNGVAEAVEGAPKAGVDPFGEENGDVEIAPSLCRSAGETAKQVGDLNTRFSQERVARSLNDIGRWMLDTHGEFSLAGRAARVGALPEPDA